jgi:sulfate adenylyltransferase subunit 2
VANPDLLGLDAPMVWDTQQAFVHLKQLKHADTKRTAERRLHELSLLPDTLNEQNLSDESGRSPTPSVLDWEIEKARLKRKRVLFGQLHRTADGTDVLHVNDARGARYWLPLGTEAVDAQSIGNALHRLQTHIAKSIVIFPSGRLVKACRQAIAPEQVELGLLGYPATLHTRNQTVTNDALKARTPHLKHLESESLQIIREAVAEAENPAMLYSMGKDSAVMLHLARKAFYPSPPPMPLLHVDTRWKFQEMYLFRDLMAQESGMDLLVHINPEAISKGINPFDHGSALHTDITKTEGLKQALDKYKFDVVFGGARRDEEKSRAKERIFSIRTQSHQWDPKQQRPEVWNLYNTRKKPGESIRVFPLSNWTELDIWQYIYQENIALVPLYFAKERPVVVRNGMTIMVDDARLRLLPGEQIEARSVRFRTLGCYPLTGAMDSTASTVADILLELLGDRHSERQGRAIDNDSSASMEKKKKEGYF